MAEAIANNTDFKFNSSNHLLGCMAHVINLAVRDGLAVFGTSTPTNEPSEYSNPLNIANLVDHPNGADVNLKTVVARIHGLTTNVRGSPQCCKNFQSCISLSQRSLNEAPAANQPSKSLILGVKTRWNSTYLMLKHALDLQEACDLYCA